MILGKVSGNVWATRKDEKISGWKLMVVEVIDGVSHKSLGHSIVAADNAGSGVGDLVLISQGEAARISAENQNIPIDAMIVGIVDSLGE